MSAKATIGSLAAAGMVTAPLAAALLTFLLQLPLGQPWPNLLLLPLAAGLGVFFVGWILAVPSAILLGGAAHVFVQHMGLASHRGYLSAGPIVGLTAGMLAHVGFPGIVTPLVATPWASGCYLFVSASAGLILMQIFWRVRRPDRPWDDEADKLLAARFS